MIKELHFYGKWFQFGMTSRLALGISISKYSFDLDILCFYFVIEF